jgi:hypothetical protein
MFDSIKNLFSSSIKGNSLLFLSVTINGLVMSRDSQNLLISPNLPGPYEIGTGKDQS